jgi:hypothetical protein
MTSDSSPSRALQQDARAWSTFTGAKYTAALRQMSSPLAQGLLGHGSALDGSSPSLAIMG